LPGELRLCAEIWPHGQSGLQREVTDVAAVKPCEKPFPMLSLATETTGKRKMKSMHRNWLVGVGLCVVAVGAVAAPAAAAPISGSAGVKAAGAAADSVIEVRAERKGRRAPARRDARPSIYVPPYGVQGHDTVGSLGTDIYGRTINRFSGQVYQTCMLDEGYGRVRPCDAGGGSGGGGSFN
jgi:hypothetical protein